MYSKHKVLLEFTECFTVVTLWWYPSFPWQCTTLSSCSLFEAEDKNQWDNSVLKSLQDLDQRYNTILQMYGEKAEEAEELRLDLEDVKNMYKTQIDELLKQRQN